MNLNASYFRQCFFSQGRKSSVAISSMEYLHTSQWMHANLKLHLYNTCTADLIKHNISFPDIPPEYTKDSFHALFTPVRTLISKAHVTEANPLWILTSYRNQLQVSQIGLIKSAEGIHMHASGNAARHSRAQSRAHFSHSMNSPWQLQRKVLEKVSDLNISWQKK